MSKLTERARERQVGTPAEVSTPVRQHHPHRRAGRGSPATRSSSAASGPSSAGTRRSWWSTPTSTPTASAGTCPPSPPRPRSTRSASTTSSGARTTASPATHVYFQGHAAPGMYARAFLEGRLDEDAPRQLPPRVSGGTAASVCQLPAPVAHARLLGVPDGVDGPRPDQLDLPRPVQPLPRTTAASTTPASTRVWCFLGDGECDEPETLGSISLAARERLDNLTWVVNCNLQRLDGPVRGNGKVIQELEAIFRGAGWNVIKVIWGSEWDELLAQRRRRRAAPQDEHHRRRRVPALRGRVAAPTSASTSSAPTPACASWSST